MKNDQLGNAKDMDSLAQSEGEADRSELNLPPKSGLPRLLWFARRLLFSSLGCLYFWRCPLLVAGVMFGIGLGYQSSMISGLFALNESDQGWLTLLVTLMGMQIFVTLRILELHEPERLGFPEAKGGRPVLHFFQWVFAIGIPAIPVLLLDYRFYKLQGLLWPVVKGSTVAGIVFVACVALQNLTGAPDSDQLVRIPWLAKKDVKFFSMFAGWLNRAFIWVISKIDETQEGFVSRGKVLSGHLLAAVATFCLLLIYAGCFAMEWLWPSLHILPGEVKALFYFLLTVALFGNISAFLCFWLDRYRVPGITLLGVLAVGLSLLPKNGHYYELRPATASLPQVSSLWAGANEKIIVISAEGGGIQASAWTTRVLTGIVEQLGDGVSDGQFNTRQRRFLESVRLLSGASGGSVGLMWFQTLYDRNGVTLSKDALTRVHGNGVDGRALSWAGYGLAYYDLTRPLLPYFFYTVKDRGWGLEQAWTELLSATPNANGTMATLGEGVANGKRPLLVFNATVADLGVPLEVTNFQLKPNADFRTINGLYSGKDVSLTTAVRLSASFPFVSPSPRPSYNNRPYGGDQDFAICDGGLYDNFGVAGAYFAIQQATESFQKPLPKEILWIQIRLPGGDRDKSDLTARLFIAPVLTLNNVRETGQRSRADQLLDLAEAKSNGKIRRLNFDYPDTNDPLNWALTESQVEDVEAGWRKIALGYYTGQVCEFTATDAERKSGACDKFAKEQDK